MNNNDHLTLDKLSYSKPVKLWLMSRYGAKAKNIWACISAKYSKYLADLPDYGGKKTGHAKEIYSGLLIFAWYTSLPDKPSAEEVQPFVNDLFFGSFATVGKVFDLNRSLDMRIIDAIFRFSGNRDRRDIKKFPSRFVNVDIPYDKKHRAARYKFTQCPNAEFAKKHGLLSVLPLLCNADYYGISMLHGSLIRKATCGCADVCDYCVVGDKNPLAAGYETVTDDFGFLVSRKKPQSE